MDRVNNSAGDSVDGLTVTGDLAITLGDVNLTDTQDSTITGATTINTGSGSIILDSDNDFSSIDLTTTGPTGSIEINDINALDILVFQWVMISQH